MINREKIYKALFDRLAGVGGFITKSRNLRHWDDVKPIEQPALFVTQIGERPAPRKGTPTTWTLRAEVYIYAQAPKTPDVPAAAALNELLDAVEVALEPESGMGAQTLGGVCRSCAIAGDIETDEGVLGDQAIAIIPIEIVAS